MASSKDIRAIVSDPNAPNRGNAPSQQLAIMGVSGGVSRPAQGTSGARQVFDSLIDFGGKMARKKDNADFIEGQMASMAGKTQAEVEATGNRTTMAGFVGLEVGNAVAEWQTAQAKEASVTHYNTDPAAYRDKLSASAADLISKVGNDEFAEKQLALALAPAMQKLSATQAQSNAQWVETETTNAYTSSLILSGQYAAGSYEGAASNPGGPITAATNAGGDYRAFAASISGALIGVESGGNVNAKNPNSTASGVGQFIASTWLTTIKKYRPDIAAGKSNAELLALRKGPGSAALSKQMSIEYTAEGARGLAASGHVVTAGTSYLAYFAGLGGARRVLSGNPAASVSTTMTPAQIADNRGVMYRNGVLISNAQLVAWADRKMGSKPAGNAQVQQAILTNPGLPPEKHRKAVVAALVTSLAAGDGSLFQNAGGLQGLAALNLSGSQIVSIQTAERAFQKERQNEYNVDYERTSHNLLEEAASGDFTEDQMFGKLADVQAQFGQSDTERRRLHAAMQTTLDKEAMGVWKDPAIQLEVMEIRNAILDGAMTAKQGVKEMTAIGDLAGSPADVTEQAIVKIIAAADRVKQAERTAIANMTKAGLRQKKVTEEARDKLSRNVLGTGTRDQIAAGIVIMKETIAEDLGSMELDDLQRKSYTSLHLAMALVQNDVVDQEKASMARDALSDPIDADGNPYQTAIDALAFFDDLKGGANATPEYIARMYKGNEKTLEMLLTAYEHTQGDAGGSDVALLKAYAQVHDPVTQARLAMHRKKVANGDYRSAIQENIIRNSGLEDTSWNSFMHMFDSNWDTNKLDDEGRGRIINDTGLGLIIDQETRSAIALMPGASVETISQIVTGQVAERGSVIGSSFVVAPTGKTMQEVLGLNSKELTAPNDAVVAYVADHAEELFGPAVVEDTTGDWLNGLHEFLLKGNLFNMMSPSAAEREAGTGRPEFVVDLVGDQLVITPASIDYAFRDDPLFDENASMPEAAIKVISARKVGAWYNKRQTGQRDGVINMLVDALRSERDTVKAALQVRYDEDAILQERLEHTDE